MLLRAWAYVDSREVAQKESRDVIAAREIFAEVGEVAAGTKPGRRSEEEVSLFKSAARAAEVIGYHWYQYTAHA